MDGGCLFVARRCVQTGAGVETRADHAVRFLLPVVAVLQDDAHSNDVAEDEEDAAQVQDAELPVEKLDLRTYSMHRVRAAAVCVRRVSEADFFRSSAVA